MESSFNAKLTLLRSALLFQETMTPGRRQSHYEGIYWLIDLLESEIRTRRLQNESYVLSFVHELKEEAERCFKESGAFAAADIVNRCCAKIMIGTPCE